MPGITSTARRKGGGLWVERPDFYFDAREPAASVMDTLALFEETLGAGF